jgi:hypothetical protein
MPFERGANMKRPLGISFKGDVEHISGKKKV